MKNRDVFKIFREHIDAIAVDHGFLLQRNTGTILPWLRKLKGGRHDLIYCQMDKWPWDYWMGSKFTVCFQNSKKPDVGIQRGAKLARIGDLLAGQHKRHAELLQNSAIAKIRVPSAKEYNDEAGFDFANEFVLDEYRNQSQSVTFGRKLGDLWLRIVDVDDVTAWATFLAEWLPHGLDRFAKLDGDEYKW